MSKCTRCRGRAQNEFLCRTCQSELRDMLLGLAVGFPLGNGRRSRPWLTTLEDARFGHTRLGESSRHSGEKNAPLVVRLGSNPEREHQWANSPVELLRGFHQTMTARIRQITERQRQPFIPVRSVPVGFIGPLRSNWRRLPRGYVATITDCAEWLADNTAAIARDESAGQLFRDVRNAVDVIENAVNRTIPPRDLGPCPTQVTAEQCQLKEPHHHPHACATRLSAPRKATETRCPSCKTLHRVGYLIELLRNDLLYWPLSSVEILGSRTSELPGALDYWSVKLPRSTFHYWRKNHLLEVRGYRNRATLAVKPDRENKTDDALFWLADVLERLGVELGEKAG